MYQKRPPKKNSLGRGPTHVNKVTYIHQMRRVCMHQKRPAEETTKESISRMNFLRYETCEKRDTHTPNETCMYAPKETTKRDDEKVLFSNEILWARDMCKKRRMYTKWDSSVCTKTKETSTWDIYTPKQPTKEPSFSSRHICRFMARRRSLLEGSFGVYMPHWIYIYLFWHMFRNPAFALDIRVVLRGTKYVSKEIYIYPKRRIYTKTTPEGILYSL